RLLQHDHGKTLQMDVQGIPSDNLNEPTPVSTSTALPRYHREKELYDNSRVPILLQEDSVWGCCLLTAQF
ncbi:MAG: hypothetical protein ABF370_03155, partial [Verrucomicrobiales bacterium]